MPSASASVPRVVIAGLSGDSGKTLVSLGLLLLARERGIPTRAFKKGPDYIDVAWLGWASGRPARNLDTFLMGQGRALQRFLANASPGGLNVVEGNRGLFDGVDVLGTHSTAELAKLFKAPVVLVVNARKATHTVAALVLGCKKLDPEVHIRGVILNQVAGARHESILRGSVESACGVPILGVLPKMDAGTLPPNRHLGLVTPQEHLGVETLGARILSAVQGRLDFNRIWEVANATPAIRLWAGRMAETEDGHGLKIAYLKDSAFTFYYPENLEVLESSGAELIPLSSLSDATLPEALDALYIGGGFPETHAATLSSNTSMLASIRRRASQGLPIYAECGGLMLLCRAIHWQGVKYPMADVLPVEVEVSDTPQGHGYVELLVDHPNPYYPLGTIIRGHEFHYSRVLPARGCPATVCAVQRGTGCFDGRDGILVDNVWASYTHVHAAATAEWAKGLLAQARRSPRRRPDVHQLQGAA